MDLFFWAVPQFGQSIFNLFQQQNYKSRKKAIFTVLTTREQVFAKLFHENAV